MHESERMDAAATEPESSTTALHESEWMSEVGSERQSNNATSASHHSSTDDFLSLQGNRESAAGADDVNNLLANEPESTDAAAEPYVGARVRVRFEGDEYYLGRLVSHSPSPRGDLWHLAYDDGDEEDTLLPDPDIEILRAEQGESRDGDADGARRVRARKAISLVPPGAIAGPRQAPMDRPERMR
jgi:hypothetical protein